MALQQEQAIAALRTVKDPELFKDVVTLGMVKQMDVSEAGAVTLQLDLTNSTAAAKQQIERDLRAALGRAGATQVNPAIVGGTRRPGGATRSPSTMPGAAAPAPRGVLPQVKNVIAVGAGKGGVGK